MKPRRQSGWSRRGGRSFLPASACRHTDRTISSRTFRQRVRRMVSEDSARLLAIPLDVQLELGRRLALAVFPADCPHRKHCYQSAQIRPTGSAGYSDFPAYSQILQRP